MKTLIVLICLIVATISNAATFTTKTYNIDQESLEITFSKVPSVDLKDGVIEYTCSAQEPAIIKFSKPGLNTMTLHTNKDTGAKIIFDPSTGWLTVITGNGER